MFLLARRLRDKIWPEPLPPAGSFEGQTVLITGATAGLGLAAAVHFVRFGATVILTSRDVAQGEVARRHIEEETETTGRAKVHVRQLDMSRYASCVKFVENLKSSDVGREGIDIAVLNAGIINVECIQSPEGWEQTIQVNTLSTTLLGLLLMSWMKQKRKVLDTAPHIIFITSRDHLDPNIADWIKWASEDGLLRYFSDERNWSSDSLDPNYAVSKLMLTYAVEKICEEAIGEDGVPQVIVNSVCPGYVRTNLGRSMKKSSLLLQLAVPMHAGSLGKSADYGARFYLTAGRTSEKEHGKYIQSLFTEEEYHSISFANLRSVNAMKIKQLVWNEVVTELRENVPASPLFIPPRLEQSE